MVIQATKSRFRAGTVSICLCLFAAGSPNAQPSLRELLVNLELWDDYSVEELAGFFADGLGRENPEERALALAGVMRLALWMPDFARSRFGLGEIERHFDDSDPDVVRQALTAYVQLAPDDAEAEAAVIERAQEGGGPLQNWEYIRYLRPEGITSDVAQEWLLELAMDETSESRYSAARALVVHMDVPPEPLLEHVMELIRGPEYFCDGNLTQFIPKFGDSAVPYLEELRELRVVLLNRIGTPARNAAGGILGEFELRMIDRAISSLEN